MQEKVWGGLWSRHVLGAEEATLKVSQQTRSAEREPHLLVWPVGGYTVRGLKCGNDFRHALNRGKVFAECFKRSVLKNREEIEWN